MNLHEAAIFACSCEILSYKLYIVQCIATCLYNCYTEHASNVQYSVALIGVPATTVVLEKQYLLTYSMEQSPS